MSSGQTSTGWSRTQDDENHYLQIDQSAPKVVIKWDSFDIGSDAHVHFEQGEGVALNRIFDSDPSRIFGQLTATGSIYLVNQNGMMFGESSRVNLHTLVASSLNIQDADFENALWKYNAQNYIGNGNYAGPGNVTNAGMLETDSGGNIFLLGSNVENSGIISAHEGRVILSGGRSFDLAKTENAGGEINETLTVDYTGEANILPQGQILADVGQIGVYGRLVQHEGLIRTLSTIQTGSSIKLIASEKVITGENSTIESDVMEVGEPVVTDINFPGRQIVISRPEGGSNNGLRDPITVVHKGRIQFPGGNLVVKAGDGGRIYLAPGSLIDVSGSEEYKSAADRVMSVQLNSEQLRDEFDQKDGILKGETIQFLINEGTNIGNVSESLTKRPMSAKEKNVKGGKVTLSAGRGDIIIDKGAKIDISGGKVVYDQGDVTVTKLVSEGRFYDIAGAPDFLKYDQISEETIRVEEFTVGADAGELTLVAKQIVFDGDLAASVVRGAYQVNSAELTDALGYQTTYGTKMPAAGILNIGVQAADANYWDRDMVVDSIVIKNQTSIPSLGDGFDPETSDIPAERNGETWLPDDLLTHSGLGTVVLGATRYITTETGTDITLAQGGRFSAKARRILHQGTLKVPTGTVELTASSNNSTDQYSGVEALGGPERVDIDTGARIITAGIQTRDFIPSPTVIPSRYLDGGKIVLKNETLSGEGVIVHKGAGLDVSGGYVATSTGSLEGAGDAGSIEIAGHSVVLEGQLKGHAMEGKNGGTLSLHAARVEIINEQVPDPPEGYSSETPIPEDYADTLYIQDDQFENSGFSHLTFKSSTDLIVNENTSLSLSNVKFKAGSDIKGAVGDYITVSDDYIADSSITFAAGVRMDGSERVSADESLNAIVRVAPGATVTTAPGGSINISGPGVDLAGTFSAPAGEISVNTTSVFNQYPHLSLLVRSQARFLAQGYNRPTGESFDSKPVWAPEDGGDIYFISSGRLIMEEGAVVDVSGAAPVTQYRRTDQGTGITSWQAASEPGSISLSFQEYTDDSGESLVNATFIGKKHLDTLRGASFGIEKKFGGTLTLFEDMISGLSDNGFDALEVASTSNITFSEDITVTMDREILMNAPKLIGEGQAVVSLNSEWIQLVNTNLISTASSNATGNAQFHANAQFIDIKGDIKAEGFSDVFLNANQDIRLSDSSYKSGSESEIWSGLFQTGGNLILNAARVYPTTGSWFKLAAEDRISILPSGITQNNPIYSALGRLTLEATDIEIEGTLAAPLGQIILAADESDGRIYLSPTAVLSTAAETDINYGKIDDTNLKWYTTDKAGGGDNMDLSVEEEPEKQIQMTASQVIGRDGSQINIDGGGSIFGYTFFASMEGSLDPLSKSSRFVIVPGAAGNLPGKAIYFEGNDMIPAGTYTILPEAYAFVPGAYIVEAAGGLKTGSFVTTSLEGYAMAVGYDATAGTGKHASNATLYTIRQASDVLSEGNYETRKMTTGNAGRLNIVADTTILNSTIKASPVSSQYRGGMITLSGTDVVLSHTPADLGNHFDFNTRFEDDPDLAKMIGKLYLDAHRISESGLWKLNIGDENTQTITFESQSQLKGQRINLTAQGDIIFKAGLDEEGQRTAVEVTGEDAELKLLSVNGKIRLEDHSLISSSYLLSMDANGLENNGTISTGKVIQLASDRLYLADADHASKISDGMVIDQALLDSFNDLEGIRFTGREKIGFSGQVDVTAQNAQVIADTPLIEGIADTAVVVIDGIETLTLISSSNVSIQADTITLQNTHGTVSAVSSSNDNTFTANANQFSIGQGDIGFSGFKTIHLNTRDTLSFLGRGSLNTYNADLHLKASGITGSYHQYKKKDSLTDTYEALDFNVHAGSGKIYVTRSPDEKATFVENDNIGGKLSFTADSIENEGTIALASGDIYLTATGSKATDGIYNKNDGIISVAGQSGSEIGGGLISYSSENGKVELESGSSTDVSAGSDTADAGIINIYTPRGSASINGALTGTSAQGRGGSFILDTQSYSDVSPLVSKLVAGGFNNRLDLRVRTGDVNLGTNVDPKVTARQFRLSADSGSVTVDRIIDVSGVDAGGRAEIYAGNNLTLSDKTQILAQGTGINANGEQIIANGGQIILGSGLGYKDELDVYYAAGKMDLKTGSVLDVSSKNGGTGGTVYLRAARNEDNTDVNLDMNATFTGASRITVEGVKTYEDSNVQSADVTRWKNNTDSFINTYGQTISSRLLAQAKGDVSKFSFIPGVQVQSAGDLAINTNIDLRSWRFGPVDNRVAGALTFKSAGNLTINGDIIDNPTVVTSLKMNTAARTTRISLSAGAALGSADAFAVNRGTGNLTIADTKTIYTEGSDIDFASGNDTIIGKIAENASKDYMTLMGMNYNIGSYAGNIRGLTGGNLKLDGGVIQTATGDISLDVGKNLELVRRNGSTQNFISGSVRTTGQPYSGTKGAKTDSKQTHLYNSGGDIQIRTQGDILLKNVAGFSTMDLLNPDAWDARTIDAYNSAAGKWIYKWSANYQASYATQGLATMGGGNLSINTGGDFFGAAGTFGQGDLFLAAKGDINGRFLSKQGSLELNSMSSIGTLSRDQVIDAFDSRISLQAQGNIILAAVVNPTIVRTELRNMLIVNSTEESYAYSHLWDLQYSQDASVRLSAAKGSVNLTGTPDTRLYIDSDRASIAPGSLYITAGKDIIFERGITLVPSANGQLELYAGNDIFSTGSGAHSSAVSMSDMDPEQVYGNHDDPDKKRLYLADDMAKVSTHDRTLLHKDDVDEAGNTVPAVISAGNDIRDIRFVLAKAAAVSAGRDIFDLDYTGQNIHADDVTRIFAGNDIIYKTQKGALNTKSIVVGGPGLTIVQAGNSIDLGTSDGIQSIGNAFNGSLETGENNLMVLAGMTELYTVEELDFLFKGDLEFLDLVDAYKKTNDSGLFNGDVELMQTVLDYMNASGFVAGVDGLRQAGLKFIQARADGNETLANQIVADARLSLVNPVFENTGDSVGDINLVNSRIFTSGGTGSIFALAKRDVNVGITSIKPPPILPQTRLEKTNTGIYTTAGGGIKMFAGRDVNVNESRIMTFAGGDIDIWADTGNINAGMGSKVAVASSKSYTVYNELTGETKIVFEPPAVGSGVRATAKSAEDAGDIYATAPEGIIDAGEAGISGRNVTIGAREVRNAQNIQSTGVSFGFTKPSESSANIGGFSGGGGLSETASLTESGATLASAAAGRLNEPLPEGYSFEPKWVDVEVIGFEKEDEDEQDNTDGATAI
ncbi:MAG: filamentous hemagglutinin family protein [Proteobacteria bacterium]|nr:filamentous hemagglutinin family protein [Pseudomonadota bacterium]